ncbi:MAG: 2,3-bisphosphoglycerate-independent phosphoglycerate mutase, partial [Defluviitaleaceae bacterium]|nr:2,3-bisphosphoglycerate-independent phosphoglycerate mutase [Defluviitaleaceae bacterium]
PPTSAKGFLAELEAKMAQIGVGRIATVIGRYYVMDRDRRWDRVQVAYDAMVSGIGERASSSAECVENSYTSEINDEFMLPTIIESGGKPTALIASGDSVIFFNFRPDRAREISRAFCDPDFAEFERPKGHFPLCYVTFTDIDPTITAKLVAYRADELHNTLGEYLSGLGKTQLRLAETEKYAHVTFFLNGGREEAYAGEDRILVPSPKVSTYDLQPEMSAHEVTDKLVESIRSRKYDVIIINYANCDMVGHTGVIPAAVKAVEVVDECMGKVVQAVRETGAQMLVCSDHGNADKMVDYDTRDPHTAHTSNAVPLILVNCKDVKGLAQGGKLCDISPTLLDMMGVPQPAEMSGRSLLLR